LNDEKPDDKASARESGADMAKQELSPEDEEWLQDHLASLPQAFGFDFEKSTRDLIHDQGIEWVKSHAGLLKLQAEYIATL
jgi:hypothetical protein